MRLSFDEVETPVGAIRLVVRDGRLCALAFCDGWAEAEARLLGRLGSGTLAPEQDPEGFSTRLRAYFRGDLGALEAIETDPGGTPFQQTVWKALRQIPLGSTVSYAGLAAAVGHPRGARAVGGANAANPIAIVIPCHRVIRSDRELCGYAFGVERKRWLLDHEAKLRGGSITA